MNVVYEKLAIVDKYLVHRYWKYVPSTLRRYAPDCVDRDTQTPLYHAPVEMSFITHAAAKILKIATYVFIIMDFLGATAP